ncbi:hypothetical protein PMG11_02989 [Penicillium brasilianum]|uniref:ABC transmembrane type-1 domain-containing protein n=1 Tax=Penicillium brasilianum TaxID=104259 RepID=A0A0F7VG95_PENBI|nr:hypothetical protein PMG11_02989 [Penicillium brasilianum]
MAFFDDRGSGELTMQFTADTEKMQRAISEKLSMTISALEALATTLILSFIWWRKFTLILLWSLIFGALIYLAGKRVGKKFSADGRNAESPGNLMAEEAISAIRTTAPLGLEDLISARFHEYLDLISKNKLFIKSFTGLLLGRAVGAGHIHYALAFWQGPRFFASKEASFVDVLTIALATKTAAFSIVGVSGNVDAFVFAIAVSRQLFSVIYCKSPIDSASTTGLTFVNVKGQIEFRNVKHIYPARPENAIFNNLNVRIEAGQTVGIVSLSGSGKSTIVHLLERFYELAQDCILLDGQYIKPLNVAWLRSQICLVGSGAFPV